MKIFIDCEWNDYKGELISMALVPVDGEPFYEVLPCHCPSEWVLKNVIPVLNKSPIPQDAFNERLIRFLDKYQDSDIEIVADWPEDIAHFCNVIVIGPGQRIGPKIMNFTVSPFCGNDDSAVLHNALEDAIAIRNSYLLDPNIRQLGD